MKFGEYLIKNNYCEDRFITDALCLQKYSAKKLGRILVDLRVLDEKDLNDALTRYLSPPQFDDNSLAHLSGICEVAKDVYFARDQDGPVIIAKKYSDKVFREFTTTESLEPRYFRASKSQLLKIRNILRKKVAGEGPCDGEKKCANLCINDPFFQLIDNCFEKASKFKASDVHIEPSHTEITIRMRYQGDLFVWKKIPIKYLDSFLMRAKDYLNLDLSVVGVPQDSRVSLAGYGVDLRVNTVPTLYGEKIVARLLPRDAGANLFGLGIPEDQISIISKSLSQENGIIIVSGPTGSGKSTTLYAMLRELDRAKKNIVTLENPVEYFLPGISQINIDARLSFEAGLRSLLRQDPDVILIGEIRDEQTAKLAFQAASTGHLVLTTLHANSAYDAISRLRGLGICEKDIKDQLRLSLGQRLLRLLCPKCARKNGAGHVRNLKGCKVCTEGVIGRIPVLEILTQIAILSGDMSYPSFYEEAMKLSSHGMVDMSECQKFRLA